MPEGLLSRLKDRLVSNARLCRAAQESGLDQFIVSKQLTLKGSGERWRPPYISDLLDAPEQGEQKRVMSSKTLADVVESVIGVSYIDGGLDKALHCMSLFLGECQFKDFQTTRHSLFEAVDPKNMALPEVYKPLEESIGYVFQEKALLVEAMTHPSYVSALYTSERLEFIGDAILDHIVVQGTYKLIHSQILSDLSEKGFQKQRFGHRNVQLMCGRTLLQGAPSTGELADAPPPDRACQWGHTWLPDNGVGSKAVNQRCCLRRRERR